MLVVAACAPLPASETPSRTMVAATTLPPMKNFEARAPQSVPVSNQALARDFIDLSFQMESGKKLAVLTRFEGPVTLRVTGQPPPTMRSDLEKLLKRLRGEAGIDITVTSASDARISVEAVPRAAIRRVLPQAACFVAPNVSSLDEFKRARRSPVTNWATLTTRERLVIVVPSDVSPQEVRDCLHEELAQALGPLNDLYRLPDSVFNDDNVHTVLTRFDMLILRATYAPELSSGMSRSDVAAKLPAIFARINPAGQFLDAKPFSATPQSYVRAIQTALGPGASYDARRRAATQAVNIATAAGWTDNRRGFAHYTQGRVLQPSDPQRALREFQIADSFFAGSAHTRLHRAFVATHLAAFALARGDASAAQRRSAAHIPTASDAQNAALLATLQLLRSEALKAEGRGREADAQRLDSLGWARYGFGTDWAVRSKMREISTLNPTSPPA